MRYIRNIGNNEFFSEMLEEYSELSNDELNENADKNSFD